MSAIGGSICPEINPAIGGLICVDVIGGFTCPPATAPAELRGWREPRGSWLHGPREQAARREAAQEFLNIFPADSEPCPDPGRPQTHGLVFGIVDLPCHYRQYAPCPAWKARADRGAGHCHWHLRVSARERRDGAEGALLLGSNPEDRREEDIESAFGCRCNRLMAMDKPQVFEFLKCTPNGPAVQARSLLQYRYRNMRGSKTTAMNHQCQGKDDRYRRGGCLPTFYELQNLAG